MLGQTHGEEKKRERDEKDREIAERKKKEKKEEEERKKKERAERAGISLNKSKDDGSEYIATMDTGTVFVLRKQEDGSWFIILPSRDPEPTDLGDLLEL